MKKVTLLLTVLITALVLISCSGQVELPGKVYLCTVALSYTKNLDKDGNLNTNDDLPATEKDQQALVDQIRCISDNKAIIKIFNSFSSSTELVTPSAIKAYIDSLKVEEDDVFIFHYSGHGDTDGSLALDADTGPSGIQLLSPATLLSWVNGLKCNKVMLLDSCYSGNFVPSDPLSDGEVYSVTTPSDVFKEVSVIESMQKALKEFGKKSDTSKLWVISACTSRQKAPAHVQIDNEKFGLLSGLAVYYLGYDTKNNKPVKKTGYDYTFYGLYNTVYSNVPDGTSIASCTPQANFRPTDLILFRT